MSNERVKWHCPGCGNHYAVRTVVGLTLCPECKRKKDISKQAEVPPPSKRQETYERTEIGHTESVHETVADEAPLKPFIDMAVVADSSPKPAPYRNLIHTLKLLAIAAKVLLISAILLAGISLAINYGFILYVVTTPDEVRKWQSIPTAFRVLIPFLPLAWSALLVFVGWVIYLILMAFSDFVRVVLDIEANTRQGPK